MSTLREIEESCDFCWREKFLVDNNRRLDATRYGASKAMFCKRRDANWLAERVTGKIYHWSSDMGTDDVRNQGEIFRDL